MAAQAAARVGAASSLPHCQFRGRQSGPPWFSCPRKHSSSHSAARSSVSQPAVLTILLAGPKPYRCLGSRYCIGAPSCLFRKPPQWLSQPCRGQQWCAHATGCRYSCHHFFLKTCPPSRRRSRLHKGAVAGEEATCQMSMPQAHCPCLKFLGMSSLCRVLKLIHLEEGQLLLLGVKYKPGSDRLLLHVTPQGHATQCCLHKPSHLTIRPSF